jgi:hypothetical protein
MHQVAFDGKPTVAPIALHLEQLSEFRRPVPDPYESAACLAG